MKTRNIDATNKILGRMAVEAANLLRGKGRADFVPYLDMGDRVVITNTDKVRVTGRKLKQKIYYRHSGYPGGIKEEVLEDLLKRDSCKVVRTAVYGMLPKNKLRAQFIKKLELHKGEVLK